VPDKDIKYTDEIIRSIALEVAKDLLKNSDEMKQHVLLEVIEALNGGEDVHNGLLNMILTRPYMEKFIDELLKYEE